jgi:hypothetical protein
MAYKRRLAVILGSGKDALSALFCLVFLWRCCMSAYMLSTLLRGRHSTTAPRCVCRSCFLLMMLHYCMSYSPKGLQHLLHCFANFCDENHLTESIRKTKVVVFHNAALALSQIRQGQQFTVQGKAVAVEDEYKYLGLMFGTGRVLLSTKLEKIAAHARARPRWLQCMECSTQWNIQSNPYPKMKLFKAVVQPSMLYAHVKFGALIY